MRKIIAMLLALMLLCGAALAESAPGDRLGYRVLAQLSDGQRNVFVSPVSLAWALSMAADGAQDETKQKLLSALGAEDTDAVAARGAPLGDAGVRWANAAFVSRDIELLPDYADRLAAAYAAERFPLTGAEGVEDWVREKTDGLIDSLPLEGLDESMPLILVNAVAMDAEWASPFDPENTWEADFHAPDGDVSVPFMHQEAYMQYGESMGIQFVCKAYDAGSLALMIALPAEGGLKRALNALSENPSTFFTFKPKPESVALSLPKLDISTGESLKEAVVGAGCWLPFSEKYANYSGISDTPLLISDVMQQVRFQLDEDGTRAAAATEVIMAMGAAPDNGPQPIEFKADRPFILAVADRGSGAILFAGVVVNPRELIRVSS